MFIEELSNQVFCPTILVSDEPSSTDAFRHAAIARAIGLMILLEDGGRAIALSGTWGSGKSTIVKLLGDFLAKPGTLPAEAKQRQVPFTKVITFDAWAHQGDPLRRTFLEYAISELGDWLKDEQKWTRRLDELARRLTTSTTSSRPELTFLGALGALSLLMSPIGYQLFGTLTKDPSKPITRAAWTLLSVGAAPLLIATIIAIRWIIGVWNGSKLAFPSIIYSSNENRVTTTAYKTPDPTTIEFENTYSQLLSDAIGSENRKVVFVIDNLDRLEDAEARAIWATLRTFFDAALQKRAWYKNVWIIVPFDEKRISRFWDAQSTGEGDQAAAEHFLTKTFQSSFRVPPSLLTDWENYFIK